MAILRIEFAGICLYVIDRRKQNDTDRPEREATVVRVLMPTCLPINGVSDTHEDGDTGVRHVPYLLADLANLTAYESVLDKVLAADPRKKELTEQILSEFGQSAVPGLAGDGPQFEVVRRLRGEEILFELKDPDESLSLNPAPLPLPDLSIYKKDGDGAPPWGGIELKDGLLRGAPKELNVRTILRGGTLTATTISGLPSGADWDKIEAAWVGSIKWERTIPGDSLTIRIRSLDGSRVTPLTLRPIRRGAEDVIELKIADLCETNPLEWKDFEPRFDKDDDDFKWLFRLFDAKDAQGSRSVLEAVGRRKYFGLIGSKKFPYPKLKPREEKARLQGYSGCTGGQFGLP